MITLQMNKDIPLDEVRKVISWVIKGCVLTTNQANSGDSDFGKKWNLQLGKSAEETGPTSQKKLGNGVKTTGFTWFLILSLENVGWAENFPFCSDQ
jgi:hypothetical protein